MEFYQDSHNEHGVVAALGTTREKRASRRSAAPMFLTTLLAAVVWTVLLTGCGGGGASGASAASGLTTQAAGSDTTSDTTAAITNGPTTGGTVTQPTPTTGTATPTPTTNPTGTTGAYTLNGKISDEQGAGLSSVGVQAQPVSTPAKVGGKLVYTVSSSASLSTQTAADGTYNLPGFNSDQYYALTINRFDRKTLRTVFRFDPNAGDQSILLIAPKGTGLVEFSLPTKRKLQAAADSGDVTMTWDTSTNTGFATYSLYRGSAANLGLGASPVRTIQSPTTTKYVDTWFTDQKISAPPSTWYRLYEKVFVPELGNFVLMGSNEVAVTFPQVTITPADQAREISTSTPIELKFTVPMNQDSVVKGLTVNSHGTTDETLTGAWSWTGNTVTFTPTTAYKVARVITARLSGAKDAVGNTLADAAASFTVASGYVSTPGWYSGQLPRSMAQIGCDPTGVLAFSYLQDGQYSYSNKILTIQSLAAYQGLGASNPALTYNSGETNLDLVDPTGNLWIQGSSSAGRRGFSNASPGTSFATYAASTATNPLQAVDLSYPDEVVTGNVTSGSSWVTGVSSTDLAKLIVGLSVHSTRLSGTVASIDAPNSRFSCSNSASSTGAGTTLRIGPTAIGYSLAMTQVTLGAPLNLNEGDIEVLPLNTGATSGSFASNAFVAPGARGTQTGEYAQPSGVAVDAAGNIYIADSGNGRVVVFDRTSIRQHTGTAPYPGYIGSFGSTGTGGFGKFGAAGMGQILVDKNNYVYVVDGTNGLVQKFAGVGVAGHQLGDFITQFAYGGINGIGVGTPMCVDPTTGNLYSIAYNATTLLNTSITKTTYSDNP